MKKPREWWVLMWEDGGFNCAHKSKDAAMECIGECHGGLRIVHVREVLAPKSSPKAKYRLTRKGKRLADKLAKKVTR